MRIMTSLLLSLWLRQSNPIKIDRAAANGFSKKLKSDDVDATRSKTETQNVSNNVHFRTFLS